ncbi:MAG: imidazole glycerol phosphate synthase subunit HisH, partial [Acutalibacteraceae bacterium]|nr:imidazole glycerol phosphate synthase subunit HisH [Acutalibacteraceae bacterium]
MVAIVDYGVGNLFSVKSSFAAIGAEAVVTDDEKVLESADCILLPGVGAFEDAIKKLCDSGLDAVLKQLAFAGKPLMGICLGMQLLFEKSYEYGIHQGLGLIKGEVRPIREVAPPSLKIPHIGWNALDIKQGSPLLKNVKSGDCVYFVHSYYATDCEESVIATTE